MKYKKDLYVNMQAFEDAINGNTKQRNEVKQSETRCGSYYSPWSTSFGSTNLQAPSSPLTYLEAVFSPPLPTPPPPPLASHGALGRALDLQDRLGFSDPRMCRSGCWRELGSRFPLIASWIKGFSLWGHRCSDEASTPGGSSLLPGVSGSVLGFSFSKWS